LPDRLRRARARLEPIGLRAVHLWYYAGQQGIRFFDYPVWYSVSVSSIFLMNGAIQHRARPYLHGWRALATLAFIPMVDMGQFFAIQWPMFIALNRQPSVLVTYICSALTIGQGLLLVYLAMALTGVVPPRAKDLREPAAPPEPRAQPSPNQLQTA
jgi:hypothetical protein